MALTPTGLVPHFSNELEADLRAHLKKQHGRETTEELAAYRRVLWAFAQTIHESRRRERREGDVGAVDRLDQMV